MVYQHFCLAQLLFKRIWTCFSDLSNNALKDTVCIMTLTNNLPNIEFLPISTYFMYQMKRGIKRWTNTWKLSFSSVPYSHTAQGNKKKMQLGIDHEPVALCETWCLQELYLKMHSLKVHIPYCRHQIISNYFFLSVCQSYYNLFR